MKTGDGDSSGIPSNVPAFLVKLWKLVEDPQYEEHISWNKVSKLYCVFNFMASGRTFTLVNYIALPFCFITSRISLLFCVIYRSKRDDYELFRF